MPRTRRAAHHGAPAARQVHRLQGRAAACERRLGGLQAHARLHQDVLQGVRVQAQLEPLVVQVHAEANELRLPLETLEGHEEPS